MVSSTSYNESLSVIENANTYNYVRKTGLIKFQNNNHSIFIDIFFFGYMFFKLHKQQFMMLDKRDH